MCSSVLLIVFLVLYLSAILVHALEITVVTVPSAVQNDTGIPVVLDCNYTLRPSDQGLVLKWFLNGNTCVYQWSPPKKPLILGPLKGRLDSTYRSSTDPLFMYKGMKILNPTTDIAGEYKCSLSTFTDEESSARNMTVFEPEKMFSFVLGKESEGFINFTCGVCGVYPEAKMSIYKNNDDSDLNSRRNLDVVEWAKSKHHSGRFDISITATASLSNVTPGDVFDCEMRITGIGYVKKKSVIYYPLTETGSSATILSLLHVIVVVAVWIILFI